MLRDGGDGPSEGACGSPQSEATSIESNLSRPSEAGPQQGGAEGGAGGAAAAGNGIVAGVVGSAGASTVGNDSDEATPDTITGTDTSSVLSERLLKDRNAIVARLRAVAALERVSAEGEGQGGNGDDASEARSSEHVAAMTVDIAERGSLSVEGVSKAPRPSLRVQLVINSDHEAAPIALAINPASNPALHVFADPSLSAAVVASLRNQEVVEIFSDVINGFYKLVGREGYVPAWVPSSDQGRDLKASERAGAGAGVGVGIGVELINWVPSADEVQTVAVKRVQLDCPGAAIRIRSSPSYKGAPLLQHSTA